MTLFSLDLLRSAEREIRSTLDLIQTDEYALLRPAACWGAFAGLFGFASNELLVVLTGEPEPVDAVRARLAALPGIRIALSHLFEPTVRPTSAAPMTATEGIYVFRFFDVASSDVDRAVSLSADAWEHFVDSERYRAEPQALFREHQPDGDLTKMLLVTWYDGFGSWELSRNPASEARELFRRRRELTLSSVAYPTRLIASHR